MQELIAELSRLYLLTPQRCHDAGVEGTVQPAQTLTPAVLEQHLLGLKSVALELVSAEGLQRAIVLDFSAGGPARGEQQWRALCSVANAVRDTLDLPPPAVSIGGRGFQLWLSLAEPVAATRVAEFAALLQASCLFDHPDRDQANGALANVAQLPPSRLTSGKWAAFIHPGMGSSFADEPWLEMAPPTGAQLGFLDSLHSIGAAQFAQALARLRASGVNVTAAPTPGPAAVPAAHRVEAAPARAGDSALLLRDASLEQIVAELHARGIEPTFRHLLKA